MRVRMSSIGMGGTLAPPAPAKGSGTGREGPAQKFIAMPKSPIQAVSASEPSALTRL